MESLSNTVKQNLDGLLSIEVKIQPIIAGTPTTIDLIIRNPFSEPVIIEPIMVPIQAPLLPKPRYNSPLLDEKNASETTNSHKKKIAIFSWYVRILDMFLSFLTSLSYVIVGKGIDTKTQEFISANFYQPKQLDISVKENSVVVFNSKEPLDYDNISISLRDNATLKIEAGNIQSLENNQKTNLHDNKLIVYPRQDELVSIELRTANYLLLRPKILELYTGVRYQVGSEKRSQVVHISVPIQPSDSSIIMGSISGTILGYFSRQLSAKSFTFLSWDMLFSLFGLLMMAIILAVVLARKGTSKGFVTLEDFYGAFVVGVLLGYSGIEYFQSVLTSVQQSATTKN